MAQLVINYHFIIQRSFIQFLNSEIQMNKYSARLLSPSVVGDYFNMNSARLLSPSVVGDYFNMNSACLLSSSVVGDCFNMSVLSNLLPVKRYTAHDILIDEIWVYWHIHHYFNHEHLLMLLQEAVIPCWSNLCTSLITLCSWWLLQHELCTSLITLCSWWLLQHDNYRG
jgi:hypothetical protein